MFRTCYENRSSEQFRQLIERWTTADAQQLKLESPREFYYQISHLPLAVQTQLNDRFFLQSQKQESESLGAAFWFLGADQEERDVTDALQKEIREIMEASALQKCSKETRQLLEKRKRG